MIHQTETVNSICLCPSPHQVGKLSLLIVSDLHAFDRRLEGESSDPSHLKVGAPDDQPVKNPLAGALKLIDEQDIKADLVVCPGDLGDKARPIGIQFAWDSLEKLRQASGAKAVVSTVGNHDVDSRYKASDPDPKGFLQSLNPPFPFDSRDLLDQYWARHFAILSPTPTSRIVVLNTCAFHGLALNELEFGRISDRTLTAVESELDNAGTRAINILMCHHHPHRHAEIELGDYDDMRNGQQLLDLLGTGRFGEWIVIHGHKHHPKMQYAAGSTSSPLVFSAGSFSASLYKELASRTKNQFYLMTIDDTGSSELRGVFRSWTWAYGMGWKEASGSDSGLPAIGGFGCRDTPQSLSAKIAHAYQTLNTSVATWGGVTAMIPEASFVMPSILDATLQLLESEHQLRVSYDRVNGTPSMIASGSE